MFCEERINEMSNKTKKKSSGGQMPTTHVSGKTNILNFYGIVHVYVQEIGFCGYGRIPRKPRGTRGCPNITVPNDLIFTKDPHYVMHHTGYISPGSTYLGFQRPP